MRIGGRPRVLKRLIYPGVLSHSPERPIRHADLPSGLSKLSQCTTDLEGLKCLVSCSCVALPLPSSGISVSHVANSPGSLLGGTSKFLFILLSHVAILPYLFISDGNSLSLCLAPASTSCSGWSIWGDVCHMPGGPAPSGTCLLNVCRRCLPLCSSLPLALRGLLCHLSCGDGAKLLL